MQSDERDVRNLGNAIRWLRESHNWTRRAAAVRMYEVQYGEAEHLDDYDYVNRKAKQFTDWELQRCSPNMNSLLDLSRIFDVSIDELLLKFPPAKGNI